MEQLDKIVIGWVAIQSLGIGGLIWRFINLFFDVKEHKKKILELENKIKILEESIDKKFETLKTSIDKEFESLEESINKKFDKLEQRETKFEGKFEEISKTHQEMRESQIKQQASLDQIKQGLSMLTSQLLEKKTDSNN